MPRNTAARRPAGNIQPINADCYATSKKQTGSRGKARKIGNALNQQVAPNPFRLNPWQTELAPITSPMFQLYMFFMITDPKTTVRGTWNQMLVAALVAVMETILRLAFRDVHSLYHALFIVGPVANLTEICFDRKRAMISTPANNSNTSATVLVKDS